MSSELCLVDSNILIRWVQPEDSRFPMIAAVLPRLEKSGAVLCYVSQNLGEFWNALTRPIDRNGYGLTPEKTDRRAKEVEARFRLLPDSPVVYYEWRKILVDFRISGVQVHDARLVASMHVYGVKRILTFNSRDFARFNNIEAVDPLHFIQDTE
jgi:predicted nucleic acid-binding protein